MKKIKSYTNIWNVEKVLYSINDLKMPIPLTFTQIVWAVSSLLFVIMFGNVPPLCFVKGELLKYIGIPAFITWFMSKKTFDGKKPYNFLKSVVAYYMRPRLTYAGKKVQYRKRNVRENITIVRCKREYVSD